MSKPYSPVLAAARLGYDWISGLTPAEMIVAASTWEVWARAEQIIPRYKWKTCGFDGARGWGKTQVIGAEINRRVEAGEEERIGLMAPTEDSIVGVQFRALIGSAKPWFVPQPFSQNGLSGLRWPNKVEAVAITAATAGKGRGFNFSLSWVTECVEFKRATGEAAYHNVDTATRLGKAQIFWDSTNRGRNPTLERFRLNHTRDPRMHPIIGGTTFDNPIFSDAYLRAQWWNYSGVRREEELLGKHFDQAAGALWQQAWIDATRVEFAPPLVVEHVGIDPASHVDETADETGLCRGGRAKDGHAYILEDRSGRYPAAKWGDIAIDWMPRGGRCTIEVNQGADAMVHVLRSRAENRGLKVADLGRETPWPTHDDPGTVYVRRHFSRESKGTRAEGPAVEWEAGKCHLVGDFPDLEREMTTYVPGGEQRVKSPNRLDAMVFVATELRGLKEDGPRDTEAEAHAASRMSEMLADRMRRGAAPTRVESVPSGWSRPKMGF